MEWGVRGRPRTDQELMESVLMYVRGLLASVASGLRRKLPVPERTSSCKQDCSGLVRMEWDLLGFKTEINRTLICFPASSAL